MGQCARQVPQHEGEFVQREALPRQARAVAKTRHGLGPAVQAAQGVAAHVEHLAQAAPVVQRAGAGLQQCQALQRFSVPAGVLRAHGQVVAAAVDGVLVAAAHPQRERPLVQQLAFCEAAFHVRHKSAQREQAGLQLAIGAGGGQRLGLVDQRGHALGPPCRAPAHAGQRMQRARPPIGARRRAGEAEFGMAQRFVAAPAEVEQRGQQRVAAAAQRGVGAALGGTGECPEPLGRQLHVFEHAAQRQQQLNGGLGRAIGQRAGQRGQQVRLLGAHLGQRRRGGQCVRPRSEPGAVACAQGRCGGARQLHGSVLAHWLEGGVARGAAGRCVGHAGAQQRVRHQLVQADADVLR